MKETRPWYHQKAKVDVYLMDRSGDGNGGSGGADFFTNFKRLLYTMRLF